MSSTDKRTNKSVMAVILQKYQNLSETSMTICMNIMADVNLTYLALLDTRCRLHTMGFLLGVYFSMLIMIVDICLD